jgi:BlaI family penicillinase repressor
MMNQIPTISDAESHVMDQLWQRAPQTAEDLVATLSATQGWQPSTVKTLLNRLLHKGAISAERDGRRFLYSVVLERDAWQRNQSVSLIDRLFGGRLAPLVAQFASQRRLSKTDIAALKALLKEHSSD